MCMLQAGAGSTPAANGGFDSPFDEADFSEPAGANGIGGGGYAPPPKPSGVRPPPSSFRATSVVEGQRSACTAF